MCNLVFNNNMYGKGRKEKTRYVPVPPAAIPL